MNVVKKTSAELHGEEIAVTWHWQNVIKQSDISEIEEEDAENSEPMDKPLTLNSFEHWDLDGFRRRNSVPIVKYVETIKPGSWTPAVQPCIGNLVAYQCVLAAPVASRSKPHLVF